MGYQPQNIPVDKIKEKLEGFKKFLETRKGEDELEGRRKRSESYREQLAEDKINTLTEDKLENLLGKLWANEMWVDKSQPFKRVKALTARDLDYIKAELKKLLWDSAKPLNKRYDEFRDKVKGLGPSTITELLCLVHPNECAIWNKRVMGGSEKLGLKNVIPLKYSIDGNDYLKIIDVLKQIRDMIKNDCPRIQDLLDTDMFMEFVYSSPEIPATVSPEVEDYDFDHDKVKEMLWELGMMIGFETDTEVLIAKGARIDVMWTAKIGNLGVVKYAFEVHRTGSLDSLILNLRKAKENPTVQKIIAVSNTKNLKKLKEEVSSLGEDFVKSLAYMEAKEVELAHTYATGLKKLLDKLEFVKSS